MRCGSCPLTISARQTGVMVPIRGRTLATASLAAVISLSLAGRILTLSGAECAVKEERHRTHEAVVGHRMFGPGAIDRIAAVLLGSHGVSHPSMQDEQRRKAGAQARGGDRICGLVQAGGGLVWDATLLLAQSSRDEGDPLPQRRGKDGMR